MISRNRKNRNRNRQKIMNYDDLNLYQKSTIKKNKLIIHDNLIEILNRMLDLSGDKIAQKLLDDNKFENNINRINWLNLTKNQGYLSYSIPDKVKIPNDEWIQKNRTSNQIRKIIRKIYKKQFSNTEIKTFESKYKTVYNSFVKENKKSSNININKNIKNRNNVITLDDDMILNNIILKTENNEILWKLITKNDYYNKYRSIIKITKNKSIMIELYDISITDNFLSIHIVDNGKSYYLKTITDDTGVGLISYSIKDKIKI
jgi:hypothetical protein